MLLFSPFGVPSDLLDSNVTTKCQKIYSACNRRGEWQEMYCSSSATQEALVFKRCVTVRWIDVNAEIFKYLFLKAIKYADLRGTDVQGLKNAT